jgi:hypothetical protein
MALQLPLQRGATSNSSCREVQRATLCNELQGDGRYRAAALVVRCGRLRGQMRPPSWSNSAACCRHRAVFKPPVAVWIAHETARHPFLTERAHVGPGAGRVPGNGRRAVRCGTHTHTHEHARTHTHTHTHGNGWRAVRGAARDDNPPSLLALGPSARPPSHPPPLAPPHPRPSPPSGSIASASRLTAHHGPSRPITAHHGASRRLTPKSFILPPPHSTPYQGHTRAPARAHTHTQPGGPAVHRALPPQVPPRRDRPRPPPVLVRPLAAAPPPPRRRPPPGCCGRPCTHPSAAALGAPLQAAPTSRPSARGLPCQPAPARPAALRGTARGGAGPPPAGILGTRSRRRRRSAAGEPGSGQCLPRRPSRAPPRSCAASGRHRGGVGAAPQPKRCRGAAGQCLGSRPRRRQPRRPEAARAPRGGPRRRAGACRPLSPSGAVAAAWRCSRPGAAPPAGRPGPLRRRARQGKDRMCADAAVPVPGCSG